MRRRPDAQSGKALGELILVERNHAWKHPRERVKGVPLHFYTGNTFSQGSSPEMGMAASEMSELPVPGGVCMKTEQLKSGHCRRNANIRGDMGAFQP